MSSILVAIAVYASLYAIHPAHAARSRRTLNAIVAAVCFAVIFSGLTS